MSREVQIKHHVLDLCWAFGVYQSQKEERKEECVFIIGSIVNTEKCEKCQLYMDRCPEGFKSWASNPWPTRSYYAARGHIFKLCIHCNSDTVI